MVEIAKANISYAFETDTIENWIHDDKYPDLSVTVTSVHSDLLGRHVPVMMSITFGRSKEHYQAHFYELIKSLEYKDWNEMKEKFPGNICDFSAGEKSGFILALKQLFPECEDELIIENFYRFCIVHFKRTAERVKHCHALVPMQKQKQFQEHINTILSEDTTKETFLEEIKTMKKAFPNLVDWIKWHLDNQRGQLIFPALAEGRIKGFGKDTNAQEGVGRWIKQSFPGKHPTLEQCISHLYRYGLQVEWDCISHRQGELTRYGEQKDPIERSKDTETQSKRATAKARRQKRRQSSDARPPDDMRRNKKRLQKALVGRPPNSKNIAPCARNFVNMKHAIPWSYEYAGVKVTNTCPMDSPLMLLYLMRKFGVLSQDIFQWDITLTEALNHIDAGRFDEARDVWLMHLLHESGSHDFNLTGTTWDLWSDSAVYTSVCELFQLQVQTLFGPCKVKERKKSKKTILNDSCPYNSSYSEETELATMARQDSHLTVNGYASRYDSLQAFFTAEFNSFGKRDKKGNISSNVSCGSEITIYGREHGCKGNRMKRSNLVNPPAILELVLYSHEEDYITSSLQFEHELEINEHRYMLGGALLFNGSHYRSVCVVHDRYLMYDGVGFGKASANRNLMRYLNADGKFGKGWAAKKLWYVLERTTDACRLDISYPIGISIGPIRDSMSESSRLCASCGNDIFGIGSNACVTIRQDEDDMTDDDDSSTEWKTKKIEHLHLKCANRTLKAKTEELKLAVEASLYSENVKKDIMAELFGEELSSSSSEDESEEKVSTASSKKKEASSTSATKDNEDVDDSTTIEKKEVFVAKYDEGIHVCKNFPDLDEKKKEIPGKSTWHRGKVEREERIDGENIYPYLIRYDDNDAEEMYEKHLEDVIVKLRVGDRIEYRGCNELRNTIATIVKIAEPYYEDDEYYDITTTAQFSELSADHGSGRFRIVDSVHPDAPPTGVWTTLEDVNMILGRLDDWDEATRADKEKNYDEFLRTYPEVMAVAALAAGTERANKRLREEMKRLRGEMDSDNDDDSSEEDDTETNKDSDSEEESDSESGEESGKDGDGI